MTAGGTRPRDRARGATRRDRSASGGRRVCHPALGIGFDAELCPSFFHRLRGELKRKRPVAFPFQAYGEDDMEGGLIWLGIIAGILGLSGVGYLFASWAKTRRGRR